MTDPRLTARRIKRVITGVIAAIDTVRETLVTACTEHDAEPVRECERDS